MIDYIIYEQIHLTSKSKLLFGRDSNTYIMIQIRHVFVMSSKDDVRSGLLGTQKGQ